MQIKAPSGRATCRTSSIATRNLPNRHHREAAAAGKAQSTIGKQPHSAKQGTFGTSNLPNRSIATRILPQCIIEKQLPPGKAQSTIGKQLHSAKQGTIGTSNLPN